MNEQALPVNAGAGDSNASSLPVPTMVRGELRIRDIDLAKRLGFEDPHKIRALIDRHIVALATLGVIATVAETSGPKGGRPGNAYYLNRKQAIFVTAKSETVQATETTIEIIERFDAYERGDAMAVLNDPAAMRGLLLTYAEKVIALETVNAELTPKADALDRIATAEGSLTLTDAAKALQILRKDLIAFLSQNGWIYRRVGTKNWLGYHARTVSSDLTHKVHVDILHDGTEIVHERVRVTPKGLTKLAKLMPSRMTLVAAE